MGPDDDLSSLLPIFLILAVVLFSALGWCMLSSCLGRPVMSFFNVLWESTVNSASMTGRSARRPRELVDNEIWEMEYRGRAG
ncbi:hypothetical protein PILCRDRAFT_813780 [Piloderma croceum F 1598]|uniref:Uncharacterized protein n=1 Tax=Piloderma croceum (strain F 1598) TaxID=765440 RepID=A0A0C3FX36_PILCF|nr:hypothetical protein PILCRDRAFT_813780 [Piloderma croceum F 1598]